MSPAAVGLVVLSAFAHVYWNFVLKRSGAPVLCAWWIMAAGAAAGAPLALWLHWPPRVPMAGLLCALGTGALYALYFWLIGLSYRSEDLSRAYPIARGVAPLVTALWGVLFFHERPTALGWTGIMAIVLGVAALAMPPTAAARIPLTGVAAAVATGLCTSAYSALDKLGVQLIPPALYIVLTFTVGAAVLGAGAMLGSRCRWRDFAAERHRLGPSLYAAALASMGGYLLVLNVLRTEPVSYVVPVRSVSVLLSVLAGSQLLGEARGWSRTAAAAVVLLGIAAIARAG